MVKFVVLNLRKNRKNLILKCGKKTFKRGKKLEIFPEKGGNHALQNNLFYSSLPPNQKITNLGLPTVPYLREILKY